MKGTFIKTAVGIICAAGLLAANSAKADTYTFDLTVGNSAISGFAGPYAQVVVDRTSATTASVTFSSLSSAGNIYLLGDGGSVAVNVNGAFSLGTISGANSGTGFTPGIWSDGGSGHEDGFGVFNQTVNSFDGFTHSSDTITINLTATGLNTWASAGSVLAPNADGQIAAAHIFITSSPADASNGALVTGFASTPDGGATIALLGLGLFGIGSLRSRFSKK
jgi:hypothetical protein